MPSNPENDLFTRLLPDLQAMEARRLQAHRDSKIGALILLGLALVGVFFVQRLDAHSTFKGIVSVGIVAVALAVAGDLRRYFLAHLPNRLKPRLFELVLANLDQSLTHSPDRHLSELLFRRSLLFDQDPNIYYGQNLVSGKIGQTRLRFSEVTAKTVTKDSDNKTRETTLFNGLLFQLDIHKPFHGVTRIFPDQAEALLGKPLGQLLQENHLGRGELIKLEDPEFERFFVVYADDPIEARYLLTPGLMQRLTDFRRMLGRPLGLSFREGKLYIAVRTDGKFLELDPRRSYIDREAVEACIAELQLVANLVDALNLDLRLSEASR